MKTGSFELQVLINGNNVKEYGHQGDTYIEGQKGKTFTLRFKNNSAVKVMAIPSVDGISVIDGQKATSESRGYIVEPYSSVVIAGWRLSLDKISEFVFDEKENSFSSKSGQGDVNVGVIGCLVIAEKPKPVETTVTHEHHYYWDWDYWYPKYRRYWREYPYYLTGANSQTLDNNVMYSCKGTSQATTDQLCNFIKTGSKNSNVEEQTKAIKELVKESFSSEDVDHDLGTGYGDVVKNEVIEVAFERNGAVGKLEIFYASRESLKKVGIDVDKEPKLEKKAKPQSFADGFCKLPD